MKKATGFIIAFTMILLMITKSFYVELIEVGIIIVSLSSISIIFNLSSKQKTKYGAFFTSSPVIDLLFFWVLALFDLIADHFIYYFPTNNQDGSILSLGLKIQEYSDDLFLASFIAVGSIVLISVTLTMVFSRLMKESA